MGWLRQGDLESILMTVGEDILEAWHRTLFVIPGGPQPGSGPFDPDGASRTSQ